MPKAVTIDDFPFEKSVDWGKSPPPTTHTRQTEEALSLLSITEVLVTTPLYDCLTRLFEQNKKAPTWAFFTPPARFYEQENRFFYHTLIQGINPSLLLERYESQIDGLHRQGVFVCPKVSQTLLTICETLDWLNTLLEDIRAKLLRFNKG